MRILVCVAYLPYPPKGGGRADVWRRIEGFVELGHSVMLLHQFDPRGNLAPRDGDFAAMDAVLDARFSYPIERTAVRTARQLLGQARVPWHASKALPSGRVAGDMRAEVSAFAPDAVWLDGPWLGEVARMLRKDREVPVLYRSHNIEHLYLRRQARASSSMRNRLAWQLITLGLGRYELDLMRESLRVLDISLDDMAHWQKRGVRTIEWLPPLPELAISGGPTSTTASDVLFVGGLSLPNNVAGVRWLVDDVLPIVRERRPGTTFTIVGSSPRPELRAHLERTPDVRTAYDVADVNRHLFGARVLANPVATGSGVQLKMLDMLMTDAPIVTRAQGVRGLPAEFAAQCEVRDSAEDFAETLVRQLDSPDVDTAARDAVRHRFDTDALAHAVRGIVTD